jgi:hypothetical protein
MQYGGDYPESGLEALINTSNLAYRTQSKIHFIVACDAPFNDYLYFGSNSSRYTGSEVITKLNQKNISVSIVGPSDSASYGQLSRITSGTGGQYFTDMNRFGSQLPILSSTPSGTGSGTIENDEQTKAMVYIWKINADATRTLIWSRMVQGSTQEINIDGLGVPLLEGESYEWGVVTYDKEGLASPTSDRATFRYVTDAYPNYTPPVFEEPITVGSGLNKKALLEIKTKLRDEVLKYSDMTTTEVDKLFSGDMVPSRADMNRLKGIINQMKIGEGMPVVSGDILTKSSLGVSGVLNIRNLILDTALSGPEVLPPIKAKKFTGGFLPPVAIKATASNRNITLNWTKSELANEGWAVQLAPAKDKDIHYYKIWRQEGLVYSNGAQAYTGEYCIVPEQAGSEYIILQDQGIYNSLSMWYSAFDVNGRPSPGSAAITLDSTQTMGSDKTVSLTGYAVEYQVRPLGTKRPDPNGKWTLVSSALTTTTSFVAPSVGSYWFRIRGLTSDSKNTGNIYSKQILEINI